MKKIVRLNERDLTRIVKRVIKEDEHDKISDDDFESFLDLESQWKEGKISWDEFQQEWDKIGSKYRVAQSYKSDEFRELANQVRSFNKSLDNYFEKIIRNSDLIDNLYDALESNKISNGEMAALLKMMKGLS